MNIKILGMGCKKCKELYNRVEETVNELGVNADIKKVEDVAGIAKYGVMKTPALVIDEQVKVLGKVPSKEEIKKLIEE